MSIHRNRVFFKGVGGEKMREKTSHGGTEGTEEEKGRIKNEK